MTLHSRLLRPYILLLSLCFALQTAAQDALPQPSGSPDDELTGDTLAADTLAADTLTNDSIHALPWPESLRARLDALTADKIFEQTQLGMMVYDLTADSTLYTKGERQRLRPASTMKLFTAITAIDRLGGSFQFLTSLYYKGEVADSTFTGDLYCKGGFDPLFNTDDLRAFAESVQALGIDTLRGRIVADLSFKDADRLGEGWCWDDKNPTLSPLLVSRHDNFCERLAKELREQGIVVEATLVEGHVASDATLLCTRSHTLDQVLMPMMKKSDNLMAEALFYQVAASKGGTARAKQAASQVKQVARRAGANADVLYVADGSGLSLYNYVTAEAEVKMLRLAYRNSNIYLHLRPSLPIAGEDGTLHKRMQRGKASGNVRAKTGTLEGVSSLAGYCTAANGHTLCFAIINQGARFTRTGHNFQDRVCQALCTE